MENFSENTQAPEKPEKRKRGRPRRFGDQAHSFIEERVGKKSGRNTRNKLYMTRAILNITTVDDDDPDEHRSYNYDWLCPERSIFLVTELARISPDIWQEKGLKQTILAELGYVSFQYGRETMLEIARQLCDMEPKPTTKHAITMIRRWRLDQQDRQGNAFQLLDVLSKAINTAIAEYRRSYPVTPDSVVDDALEFIAYTILDRINDDDDSTDESQDNHV